jgi:hypothetical protein
VAGDRDGRRAHAPARGSGKAGDRHRSFADAGHIIRPPIIPTTITWTEGLYSGGTPEGCARAIQEAWAEILRFLGEHLA